jgi:peptidyl-prolyl cis-trans isomerase D
MLSFLRDKFKYLSWMLWVIVIIFIAFIFVDFGGGLSKGGDASNRPTEAAAVGAMSVSMAEFQDEYRQLEEQFREMYGEQFTPEVARQMRLPLQALDRAIAQKILAQEAAQSGLIASDEELRRAVLDVPAFQDAAGNFIGQDRYKQILAANGRSVASFEKALRQDLAVRKFAQSLAAANPTSDQELERLHRQQNEQASVRYVLAPVSRYQGQASVTAAEARDYFDSHLEEFRLPEQRVVDYVLVETGKLAAQLTASDADLRTYYDQHPADYTHEEQVRARHILLRVGDERSEEEAKGAMERIRQRLAAGEDFAKIATGVSEDPGSKASGGDLGFFGRGRMIKEFEDAAFAGAVGDLVGPVRTAFGLHLLKIEGKNAGGQIPFEQVKAQLQARVQAEQAQQNAETKATEIFGSLAKATATEKELKAAAEAHPSVASFATTPPFGAQDVVPGIGRGGEFGERAFGAEVGKALPPIRTPRGWVIASLREVKPPRLPEFSEAESKAQNAVTQSKQRELALAELRRAASQVGPDKTLAQVAQGLGLPAQESASFGANGAIAGLGQAPELAKAALAASPGALVGPIALPQGAVLFEVLERKRFDPIEFQRQKQDLRAQVEREELNRLLGALVEKRRQELKVTYSRTVLEQFGIVDEPGKTS